VTGPPGSPASHGGTAQVLLGAHGLVTPATVLAATVALIRNGPLAPCSQAARPKVILAVGLKAARFARNRLPLRRTRAVFHSATAGAPGCVVPSLAGSGIEAPP
jgi:hypothetical protein